MTAQTSRPSPIFPVAPAHPLSPHDRHLRATATATVKATQEPSHTATCSATKTNCGPSPFPLSCPFTPLRRPLPGPPHLSLLPPPDSRGRPRRAHRPARPPQLRKDGSPFGSSSASPRLQPPLRRRRPLPVVRVPLFRHRASSPVRDLAFRRCCSKEVLADSFSDFNCRSFCSCYNQLTGSIPTQLGALRNLRVPSDAPSLKVLDVQKNTLSGNAPPCNNDVLHLLNPERIGGVFKQEVQVHSGFLSAYDSVRTRIISLIRLAIGYVRELMLQFVASGVWRKLLCNGNSVAYFVGVQIEDDYKNEDGLFLSPEKRQLSVVGVVKVVVRSLSMTAGSSKS
ncbi:hypothetical protein Fmac_020380 [Flemingia macrophylla]|uniref:Uncharacterized protein n=1 Tax=Flemingia macrophylla TaxID=520843 RepID=A0ABD1LTV0_9FABA